MPVYLKPNPSYHKRRSAESGRAGKPFVERRARPAERLTIGLVNNMGDGALQATERQFASLLNQASAGVSIDLALYSFPEVVRGEVGARHVETFYSSVQDLWDTHLDGIIVTGREPLTPDLRQEAYWPSFTRTLDWARENTYASVWSCLAAHAAVLHMDDIQRVRSQNKHFGVFECERLSDHPLIHGASASFRIPHSRWNGLPEQSLKTHGYEVITRTGNASVDTFVREDKSLFVFFNGHPEYASNTLLLEYKRDVTRFLRSETQTYPLLPENYFDPATADALKALELRAKAYPSEERIGELAGILETIRMESTWHETAVHMYKNWLHRISEHKRQSQENSVGYDSHSAEILSRDRSISSGTPPMLRDAQPARATEL